MAPPPLLDCLVFDDPGIEQPVDGPLEILDCEPRGLGFGRLRKVGGRVIVRVAVDAHIAVLRGEALQQGDRQLLGLSGALGSVLRGALDRQIEAILPAPKQPATGGPYWFL